jgi:hypothetical protein
MATPMGTWNINANGTTGTLILSASTTGAITGTVFGEPLSAVWDETSQVLHFSRATKSGPDFAFEVYTGTLFPAYATPNGLVASEGVPLMLAGNFGQFSVPGGPFGPSNHLGWFATNQVKFKEKEAKEKEKEKEKETLKEKESIHEKVHPDKPTEVPSGQSLASRDTAASAASDSGRTSFVAVGRSFVGAEERPAVGTVLFDERNGQ